MSRNNNSRNNQRTPFCKVCFDAKKPQSVYESHWVKDREGNVTCTTLNSQECRYCFKNGHTVKHCPILAGQNAEKEKQARRQEAQKRREQEELKKANEKAATKAKKTGFEVLRDDDSDDEEESQPEQKQQVEEYPALPMPSARVENSGRPSFASALKKPVAQVKKEETTASIPAGFAVLTRSTNGTTSIQETKMPSSIPASVKPVFCGYKGRSWNDLTDDEDEDDDEFGKAPTLENYRQTSAACDDW
jgi:hypothetical protein